MEILLATGAYPPDIGGPATYSKILVTSLSHRGIHAHVVSFGSVRMLPWGIRHLAFFFLLIWHGFSKDVFFAQDPVSVGFPTYVASRVLRKKFVVKIVGDYAWEQGRIRYGITETLDEFLERDEKLPPTLSGLRYLERFVARSADSVIVPSKYLKRVVLRWGVPSGKIVIVYNAFSPPPPLLPKEKLREILQFSGKLIVTSGRLVPWKGFADLIRFMPGVVKKIPTVRLLIVGDGPEQKHLEEIIEEKKLEKHVVLTGAIEQEILFRYVKAADLFVLNTAYEGLSHQLLEVMAIGTPIVTTNVGGNAELISDKKTGRLVTYGDTKTLQKVIVEMLQDTAKGAQFAENAKRKVAQFDTETMIKKTIDVLKT